MNSVGRDRKQSVDMLFEPGIARIAIAASRGGMIGLVEALKADEMRPDLTPHCTMKQRRRQHAPTFP